MKHILIDWEFDMEKFAAALNQLHGPFTWVELGEIIGVNPATVQNWANGMVSDDFPHPRMSNFIAVVNELDLDPRDFWRLVK